MFENPDYYANPYEPNEDEWSQEDGWLAPERAWPVEEAFEIYPEPVYAPPADFSILIGLAAFLFLLFVLARSGPTTTWELSSPQAQAAVVVQAPELAAEVVVADPQAFAAPYQDYVLTQGIHGASYGQMAVDLAAGQGAPILSPINGEVSDKYVDQYGNPTLIIENEVYIVKLLHGVYTVEPGDWLDLGDQVGTESNLGYTTDMRGVLCAGRTDYCGYHTHLNVFSKLENENVNPLPLLAP